MALALIVLALYARTFDFELLKWDDHRMMVENPHVAAINAVNLRWMFTDTTYNRLYMPLGWLAYAISVAMFSFNPAAHHAINVLLHTANTLLVYAVLLKILRLVPRPPNESLADSDSSRGHLRIAFVFALLWAVHPLRVEVVAWVGARIHAEAALFTLSALLLYFRATDEAGQPTGSIWRTRFFWAAVACYTIGILTFPAGLMLPAVLVALDLYLLHRAGIWQRILEKAPFFIAAAIPVIVSLWGRETGKIYTPAASMAKFGVVDRAVQALFVWCDLAVVQLWPINLAPVYTRLIRFDISSPILLTGVAITVAVTFFTFAFRRRHPLIWATWLCHLVLLVPFLGLTEHPHVASDRYTYLDSIIWAAFLAVAVAQLAPQPRRMFNAIVATVAATIFLTVVCFAQLDAWRDSISLFAYTVSTMPDDLYRAVSLANRRRALGQ